MNKTQREKTLVWKSVSKNKPHTTYNRKLDMDKEKYADRKKIATQKMLLIFGLSCD